MYQVILRILVIALALGPINRAEAQTAKTYRIGYLGFNSAAPDQYLGILKEGLRSRGYEEGRNLAIETAYAEGDAARLPELASRLVGRNVDAIFAGGEQVIRAAMGATRDIPIVMVSCDAVAAGLIASLARPGGNLTGLTCISADIAAKRFELLKELASGIRVVTVIYNGGDASKVVESKQIEGAAAGFGIRTVLLSVIQAGEFDEAFASVARAKSGAVVVCGDPLTLGNRARIVELAAKARVPTVYGYASFADAGGLMSFGPSLREMYLTAASYLDRVLKGAKPAELPVEQPTRFELVLNQKTASALGIKFPQSILVRADRLIE